MPPVKTHLHKPPLPKLLNSPTHPSHSDRIFTPPFQVECEVRSAQLLVVDMAGSERVKRAGSEGLRMKEAMNINTSLLCFGNVVRMRS